MHHVRFAARWLIYLVVGTSFVSLFLVPTVHHRYDDHGVGEYYGTIRGRIADYDADSGIVIRAESSRTWRWSPPDNYTYESIQLSFWTDDERRIVLHVPEMTFVSDENVQRLTLQSLEALLGGSGYSDDSTSQEVLRLFRTAGTGDFPSPRHHYYDIGDDKTKISGYMAHWSMGTRISHLTLCWFLIWLTALVCRVWLIRNGDDKSAGLDSGNGHGE